MKRILMLAAALTIPAAAIADAAPRKASKNPQAETTGVATPDTPGTQTPAARRARNAAQTAIGRSVPGPGDSASGTPGAQSTIQVGDRCFRPTDAGRGYGYWTSCDQVYTFVLSRGLRTNNPEVLGQVERGSDGGGGDGGGGSSGGGQR